MKYNIMTKSGFLLISSVLYIASLVSCTQNNIEIGPYYRTLHNNNGKREINLTSIYKDQYMNEYIEIFNKQNIDYVVNYKYYIEPDDYTSGVMSFDDACKKFNADLMAGYTPDIILCYDYMPIQSYINKNMLADIYMYMGGDSEFNIDNYLINALTATEQNNQLFNIFFAFNVHTIYVKSSDFDRVQNWDIDALYNLIATKPNIEYVIGGYTRQMFMNDMILKHFVNDKLDSISVDNTKLLKLFAIADYLPISVTDGEHRIMAGMREADPIVNLGILRSPRDIRVWEQVYAGSEISFIGFPQSIEETTSLSTDNSYFEPFVRLAIMEHAEEKDGAWEFLKFALDFDIYKHNLNTLDIIPVNISLINDMMNMAKENINGEEYSFVFISEQPNTDDGEMIMIGSNDGLIYIIDKDGNIKRLVESVKIPVGNNTDEDNAKFFEFISSVNNVLYQNITINNIISDEINDYYSGLNSVDQVADNIEKRVNLYLNEIK